MKTKKAKKCKTRQRYNRKRKKTASHAATMTPISAESATPSHGVPPHTHFGKAKSWSAAPYPLWQSKGIPEKPLHGNSHKLEQEVIYGEEDEFKEYFYN